MDIQAWIDAMQSLTSEDAFRARLSSEQWRRIAPYLVRRELATGAVLIRQGQGDRAMHLIARGSLQVLTADPAAGRRRAILLRAGAVVGESSLFGSAPAPASVEALSPCVLWSLTGPRLDELALRSPSLALELLRAAGAVMQVRMRAELRGEPIPA